MHWKPFVQQAQASGSLLPLMDAGAAEHYLQCRAGLLREEQKDSATWQRPRRLLDRSAAFWLTHAWFKAGARTRGLAWLAPQPGQPHLRAFWLGGKDVLGNPWDAPTVLVQRLGFAVDAVEAYGALVVPGVVTDAQLKRLYGLPTVRARWQHHAQEKAQALQAGMLPCVPAPSETRERF